MRIAVSVVAIDTVYVVRLYTVCSTVSCVPSLCSRGGMTKLVVSGKVESAAYSRAEMLADQLKAHLPNFHVHKIAVPSAEWPEWVKEECKKREWAGHSGEVLVWRELVKRGGRGMYMGGVKEFEEYALHYHNITPYTDTITEEKIAMENVQMFESDRLEAESRIKPRPLQVTITAASSPLAYHLIQRIVVGDVFGDQLITLRLLDTNVHSDELSSIAMEITDMASPMMDTVLCTSSVQDAFKSSCFAFILDYSHKQVRKGTEEIENDSEGGVDGDLAEAATLYQKYGRTIDFCSQKDVRVIVNGRFSNLGTATISRYVTSISPGHIVAASCLTELRVKSVIAFKLGLNAGSIEQVCVWGRCDYGEGVSVDVSGVRVHHYPGAIVGPDPFSLPLTHCLHDSTWLADGIMEDVKTRAGKIHGILSEAVAIGEMARKWITSQTCTETDMSDVWQSVGVISDGNCYGFPEGVACSVPAKCEGGEWKVVRDLQLSPTIQEHLEVQRKSLVKELELGWQIPQDETSHLISSS